MLQGILNLCWAGFSFDMTLHHAHAARPIQWMVQVLDFLHWYSGTPLKDHPS